MTLTYVLHDAGWATATIEHDGKYREMTASYLSDAVWKMIDAAIGLMNGAKEVRFGFTDEPGEHECVVTRDSDCSGAVQIRIFWHKDWPPPGRDTGDEVFACDWNVSEFCQTVFACCQRLLDEHGEEGYKRKWVLYEFPTETFERLSHLLNPSQRTPEA